MRLVTFSHNHPPRTGAMHGDHVVDLGRAFGAMLAATGDDCVSDPLVDALVPGDTVELLRGGHRSLAAARDALDWAAAQAEQAESLRTRWDEPILVPLADVQLGPPVRHPRKVIGVGLNYRDHAEEQGAKIPRNPILFAKFDRGLIGHGQPIEHPDTTQKLDYEAELAVVIGRHARDLEPEEVDEHIAGYTAFNDVTARDIQFADRQWLRGKVGDTHAPIGPWLVTRDELPDPSDLGIRLRHNGDVLQDSTTAQLIFDVPTIVSFVSRTVTLEPGDVIATGTPGGVGFARDPEIYLREGDVVSVEIDGIGTLENPVVAASSRPHR